jgi:hypothetical protein
MDAFLCSFGWVALTSHLDAVRVGCMEFEDLT